MVIFIDNIINFLGQYQFLGNTGVDYFIAILIFIGVSLLLKTSEFFIVRVLKKASKKTKNNLDNLIIDFLSSIHWPFFVYAALYLSLNSLILPVPILTLLDVLLAVFIAYYLTKGLIAILDHFIKDKIEKRRKEEEGQNTSMILVFGTIIKVGLWTVAGLMVLANFGIEITPLIMSLGIGGIAIALALQPVLTDLFAAFAMYFDKPFQEGDFIIIGNDMGVIDHIGIKTTRINTLQGQELIISNTELTNSRINNYKRMKERRVVFGFGVEYSTPSKKLKKINEIVKKIVSEVEHIRLDRVHFQKFADFSLNFEVVYYVDDNDYNKYMDVQQEINFKLKEAFEKEKIVFAFPTQTVFLKK